MFWDNNINAGFPGVRKFSLEIWYRSVRRLKKSDMRQTDGRTKGHVGIMMRSLLANPKMHGC